MVDLIRLENGKQAGGFFGQALRAFGQNVSVVNFDFNGQITHVVKPEQGVPRMIMRKEEKWAAAQRRPAVNWQLAPAERTHQKQICAARKIRFGRGLTLLWDLSQWVP